MKAAIKQRNVTIDYVRSICMLCIILAHVNPPELLHQLRSFDVVGLVLISSMCMKPVAGSKPYLNLLKRRVKRLLVPTYVSITIVLVGTYVLCRILQINYIYRLSDILSSYLLIEGIGYVWIVRLFFLIAVASPLLIKLRQVNTAVCYSTFVALLCLCKLIYLHMPSNKLAFYIIYYFVLYTVGYLIIAGIGFRLCVKDNRAVIKLAIGSLAVFCCYKLITRVFLEAPLLVLEKHPPMLDWITYGLVVFCLIYLIVDRYKEKLSALRISKYVIWFSVNSFTVYFIHIFVLMFLGLLGVFESRLFSSFVVRYLFVLILSVLLAAFYIALKKRTADYITAKKQKVTE